MCEAVVQVGTSRWRGLWVALRHVLQVAARASRAAGMAGKDPVIQGGVHRSRSARCPSCTHRRLQGMCSSSCVRASTRCVTGSTPTPHCRQSLRGSQAPCSGWMKALFWVPYCTVSPLQPSNGGVTVPVLLPHRLCGHGPQPPPWVQRLQQPAAPRLPPSVATTAVFVGGRRTSRWVAMTRASRRCWTKRLCEKQRAST